MDFSTQNQNPSNLSLLCFPLPPPIHSHGVLEDSKNPGGILNYPIPHLELQMCVFFLLSHGIHYILKKIGASSFISFGIAGIILSPTFLGKYKIINTIIFPNEGYNDTLHTVMLWGYSMFLFITAVEMDVGIIVRTGNRALSIGILSVLAPLLMGMTFERLQNAKDAEKEGNVIVLWSTLVLQGLTSFPVVADLIVHQLRISNSELGRLGLSSSLIAEILGIFCTVFLASIRQISVASIITNFTPIIGYVVVLAFIVKPMMNWIIRRTPQTQSVGTSYLCIFLALAFLSEAYFHMYVRTRFLGPFIFALAIPAGVPLGSAFSEKFGAFTYGVLFPILVARSAMKANLYLAFSRFRQLKSIYSLIFLTNSVKLLATLVPALLSNMPLIDSMAIALISSYKGVTELCTAVLYNDMQLIDKDAFAAVVLTILLHAAIIPVLVRFLYDPSRKYAGYQTRNIMCLKSNSQLRYVACIHRPDNVESVIRLLDAFYPTKTSPFMVHVLHLIRLVGRSTPVFISHAKQKTISHSSSQTVIHAFTRYEKANWGVSAVETFTAISSMEVMYEDICTLALDKLASLILIPLHRKWSIHGTVESEDNDLRALNFKVLEKAPCSVGIFFDRGRIISKHTLNKAQDVPILSLCVIFLGGSDDREALSLAKRMANNPNTRITILHFLAKNHQQNTNPNLEEEIMCDEVILEEFKRMGGTSDGSITIRYEEHVANDGPETLIILHSLANKYDLFIMGRRYGVQSSQTGGLSEWIEFPEIGIIGDFFASKHVNTRASVLVVQQQKQIKRLE